MLSFSIYEYPQKQLSQLTKFCTYNGLLLPHEDTVSDAQVFDHIAANVHIVTNLKMLSTMRLCRLLVLVGDHEIVNHSFDCSGLLVQIVLVLLYALLASKVNIAITKVNFLSVLRRTKCVPLDVIVHRCVQRDLWISSL